MRERAVVLGVVLLLPAAAAGAEGLAIDHREVGCIVAGQYPSLTACFAPASQLARARVYFRVADAAPDWYYVEMASNAPCHAGVLPRPKKDLVGRRVQYYVDALDRSFAESRTPEAEALVVSKASECQGKILAPLVNGATVAVFPSLPAGFAGAATGLGGAATALIAVGGAGVVGGGVAMAAGGSDSPSGNAAAPPTPETVPPAPTTTTTTTVPAAFNPVLEVRKDSVLVTGDSVSAPEPFTLGFDMCRSTGPYRMRFGVWVDGVQRTAGCSSTLTFNTSSAASNTTRSGVSPNPTSRTYAVRMTIRSEGPNNSPKADRDLTVQVFPAGTPSPCSGDTQGPLVALTKPTGGTVYSHPSAYPVHFEASADDTTTGNNGVALIEYKVNYPGPDQRSLGPAAGPSPWPLDWSELDVRAYLGTACSKALYLQAYAQDGCGNASISSPVQVTVYNTGTCVPDQPLTGADTAASSAAVVSELGVPDGAGQVVVNAEAAFPRTGRHVLAVRVQAGENRVEATLVEARSGGTWRVDLGGVPGLMPETLRVVAGDVVQVAADSVTFRLQGRPGERVVFVFITGR